MSKKTPYDNLRRIAQVELAARQCGMSYGQYVSVTGGAVPPPEELLLRANPDALNCPNCGKWFLPTGRHQLYCSPACRKAAYDRRNAAGSRRKSEP